jgi:hypothetical protein
LDCKGTSPNFPLLHKVSKIDTATYISLIMTDKSQSLPRFHYGLPDIYDGAPWTEMAIADLRAAVESGYTPQEAAGHFCRSGTVDDVRRKAEELGLERLAR